jgi:hypothetical protein
MTDGGMRPKKIECDKIEYERLWISLVLVI